MAGIVRRAAASIGVVSAIVGSGCTPAPRPYTSVVHEQLTAHEGIVFGQARDVDGDPVVLSLDLVEPADDPTSARPAVIFVHGGGFVAGARSEVRYLADDFARRGYVTATIDYRLHHDTMFSFAAPTDEAQAAVTDARHDAQAAVRWVRANAGTYRVDPHRIAVVGYSAGGITALGVAFRSDDAGSSGTPGESSRVCTAVSISGIAAEGGIDATDPSVTLIHGGADEMVPTGLARVSAMAAAGVGRLAGYHEYPGVGHLLILDPRAADYRQLTAEALADAMGHGPCS